MKSYTPKEKIELYEVKKKIISSVIKNGGQTEKEDIKKAEKLLLEVVREKPEIKTFALRWMEQVGWFNNLPLSVPLEGLKEAVRRDDGETARVIVKEVQKKSPLHPELPTFKLENGEYVLHYAARNDKYKVLTELLKVNPLWVQHKDEEGNTPLHIASKYICINTLLAVSKKHPFVLNIRNKIGLKPTDLESGAMLLKLIPKEDIETSHTKSRAIQKTALRKILKGQRDALATKKEKMSSLTRL